MSAPADPRGVLLVVEQLRRPVPGGIGTYARGLLAGLGALGPGAPALRLYASRSTSPDPLAALGFPLATSRLGSRALTRLWDLGMPLPSGGALVHAVGLPAPRAPGRPVCVTVHDLAWRRHPETFPPAGRRWHEAALARLARRAAYVVAPSTETADELLGAGLGLGRDRVVVIPEGADHLPPPDREAARTLLTGLGVDDGYLLSVGTLEPRKNLGRLLAAYAVARPRLPEPWPLVVVGPRGWSAGVPAPAAGVVLAGEVSAAVLAALYAGARCVAYVPLSEGFGLPVVEAMAAGAPVVASAVPAAGGATLTVAATDVEAIAEGLVRGAGDEAVRTRLIAAGRAHVAPLTWEASAAAHCALWRRVLGDDGGARGR